MSASPFDKLLRSLQGWRTGRALRVLRQRKPSPTFGARLSVRLELALRSDLGIYGVELAQAPGALHTPQIDRY